MKRKITLLIFLGCFASTGWAIAQSSPLFPDVQVISQHIAEAQGVARARSGRYAQILTLPTPSGPLTVQSQRAPRPWLAEQTHATTPTPALLTFVSPLCPPDAATCPPPLPAPDGVQVYVNTYTGPTGDGYEIVYEYQNWRKIENHGPETWRAQDWHIPALRFVSPLRSPLLTP